MKRFTFLTILVILSLAVTNLSYAAEAEAEDKAEETEKKAEKKKSGKIYAIKDRNGNIVGYTDDPLKGSDEVKIQKGSEYTPPESETVWTKVEPKVVEEKPLGYAKFAIASPTNDATIRNNAGNIQVALDIRPALQPGHKVQVLIDGNVVSESRGVIQSAANVDRGTHSISANIIDSQNNILKSTPAVTIHLHRATARR